jgi:hypothetical protein
MIRGHEQHHLKMQHVKWCIIRYIGDWIVQMFRPDWAVAVADPFEVGGSSASCRQVNQQCLPLPALPGRLLCGIVQTPGLGCRHRLWAYGVELIIQFWSRLRVAV